MRTTFPIKGYEWIFYVFGWLTGAGNVLFWLFQIIAFLMREERSFIGPQFHRRVFYWGIAMSLLVLLGLVFMMFMIFVMFAFSHGMR